MTTLTLYTNPMSRGRIARWMLEEIGVPYRTEIVSFAPGRKTPGFLALNPMGKVPTLVHGGRIVTEAAAICAYLADAFPDAGLAPPLPRRGAYYRWLFFGAGPVESAIMDRYRKLVPNEEEQRMVGYGTFERMVAALDRAVSNSPWLAGEAFSAADVYAGSQIDWPMQFGMIEPTPALAEYVQRLRARPAYQRVTAIDG